MKRVKQFWRKKDWAERALLILGTAEIGACILACGPAVVNVIIGALSLAVVMAIGGITGMLIHESLK